MTNLKGSEKQIKWANEIVETINTTLNLNRSKVWPKRKRTENLEQTFLETF